MHPTTLPNDVIAFLETTFPDQNAELQHLKRGSTETAFRNARRLVMFHEIRDMLTSRREFLPATFSNEDIFRYTLKWTEVSTTRKGLHSTYNRYVVMWKAILQLQTLTDPFLRELHRTKAFLGKSDKKGEPAGPTNDLTNIDILARTWLTQARLLFDRTAFNYGTVNTPYTEDQIAVLKWKEATVLQVAQAIVEAGSKTNNALVQHRPTPF